MNSDFKKKEIVKFLLSKDILLSAAILEKLDDPKNLNLIHDFVSKSKTEKLLLLGEEFEALFNRKDISEIDWLQFDEFKVKHEKGKAEKIYNGFKEFIFENSPDKINLNKVGVGGEQKSQNGLINNSPGKPLGDMFSSAASAISISSVVLSKDVQTVQFSEKNSQNFSEISLDVQDNPNEIQTNALQPDKRYINKDETKKESQEGSKENIKKSSEATKTSYLIKEKEDSKLQEKIHENSFDDVKLVFSYNEEPVKQDIQDFVSYYTRRYEAIEKILRNRQELSTLTSINRIFGRREKENVSIIGLVRDKHITKNNNIILTLEDSTAEIKVLVSKSKPDNYEMAKNIVFDEVIGIVGMNGDNIVFANKVILPDVPLNKELKKLDEEVYVVFLSDIHVGSNNFLPEQFNKFLNWINGNFGSEQQRHIASKVKYVFVIGDLVDGVGIYPGQEKELVINEINEQYNECARLLSKIPTNIRIIICPGNHDAMRISEPQLPLYKDFASAIWRMPNTIMVSNPALVNIAAKENFSGFDVLMYHGYSFDYYVAHVDSIRQQGGYDRADLIMKFLLQKRHLAPTHRSTLYIADTKKDPLVISQIPDFFVTGHIHKSSVSEYRNITLICGSCWQSKTSFQEKVGHNPEPARVPVVNLQSREIKVLRF